MWAYVLLGLVVGGGAGLALGFHWASQRHRTAQQALEKERDDLKNELEDLRQRHEKLQIECSELRARLDAAVEKNQWLNQAQEILKATFQSLASDALNQNAQQLLAQAKEAIGALLADVKGEWGESKAEIQGLITPIK